MRKIFCIGFGHTGTNTLHATVKAAGLRCLHHGSWARTTYHKGFAAYVKKHNSIPPAGHPSSGEFHGWEDYDFFSDGRMAKFTLLETLFPNSYFMLNTRSRYNWLTGIYNHLQINRSDPDYSENYLYEPTAEFLYHQLQKRIAYHRRVIRHFRHSDHFAIVDIEKQEESEVLSVLSTAIERPVERLIVCGTHKHLDIYEPNPAVVEEALTMYNLPSHRWHLSLP